jgi:hypothetical protein
MAVPTWFLQGKQWFIAVQENITHQMSVPASPLSPSWCNGVRYRSSLSAQQSTGIDHAVAYAAPVILWICFSVTDRHGHA